MNIKDNLPGVIVGALGLVTTLYASHRCNVMSNKMKLIEERNAKLSEDMKKAKFDIAEYKATYDNVHAGLHAASENVKTILKLYELMNKDMTSIQSVTDNLDYLDDFNRETIEESFSSLSKNDFTLMKSVLTLKEEVEKLKGSPVTFSEEELIPQKHELQGELPS